MAVGRLDVEVMLRTMTAKQFRAWEMYAEMEPFGEERADFRAASIVQMIYNVNRGKGVRAIKLDQCLLRFGEPPESKPAQTSQQQFAMLKILAAMHANETTPEVVAGGPEPTAKDLNRAVDSGVISFADAREALQKAREAME